MKKIISAFALAILGVCTVIGQVSRSEGIVAPDMDLQNIVHASSQTSRMMMADDVLLLHAEDPAFATTVQTQLLAQGFTTVDIHDAGTAVGAGTIPTLAQLNMYDAILVWSDFGWVDGVALGNVLAQYADGGGGVVDTQFAMLDNAAGFGTDILGDFDTTYDFYDNPGGAFGGVSFTLGTVLDPGHPIMAGVTAVDVDFEITGTVDPAATIIAEDSNGNALVYIQENMGPSNVRRASLSVFAPFLDPAQDGFLMIANALNWVATTPVGAPPMITCPMDVTTTASAGICGAVVAFPPPLVVDPDGDLDTVIQTAGLPSGSEFPVGMTVVEFTATDLAGNSATCSFTVTVTDDEAPVLTCPADITTGNDAGVCEAFVTVPTPTIMDNCPVLLPNDVVFVGPLTDFVDDGNGELDDTPTTITGLSMAVPGNDVEIFFETNGDFGASSECFVLNGPDGSEIFNECDLGDDCVTATRTFTVAEATWNGWITTFGSDLTFTLLADSSVDFFCDDTYQITVTLAAPTGTLTNDYNGTADASDIYPVGTTTVTWTYTDDGGNSGSCTMDITVEDTEAPVIVCAGQPNTSDIMVNGSFESGDFTGWTAVDNPNPFVPWGVYTDIDGGGFFTPATPTDGTLLAGNGFDGEAGEAVLYQDVSIAAAATSALLTWDENIDYDLASFCTGCSDRIYEVQVRDLSDNVLEVLVQVTATAGILDNDNVWVSQSADLAAYAGQDIRIAFWQNIPDSFSGPAKFALDNVQLVEDIAATPFTVELDANGMATINVSDLVTVTDNCGTFTVTSGEPASACDQSNASNALENGYFTDPGSGFVVANDILVMADQDFTMDQVTMNLFHDIGATIATVDFTYYDDNAGQPGTIIGSEVGVVPTSQTVIGNNFGFDVSETVCDITPFLFASQAGVDTNYWVAISVVSTAGGITAWEVSSASGAGSYDALSSPDGTTWNNPSAGSDGVYIFSGTCGGGISSTLDFDCSNLGLNTVEVTVTDDAGNESTCTSTVEVLDVTDPVLICQDVTIEIGPDGTTEIDPEDLLANAPSTFDAMVIGSDNQSGTEGFTDFTVPVTADVTVSFDWDYTLNDVPGFDSFGYIVNGVYTQLTDPAQGNQSGSSSVTLVAGDEFGFRSQTDDNIFGNNETMITNFMPGFDGQFAPENWTLTLTNSDGDAFFIEIPGGPLSFDACGITVLATDITEVTCDDVGTTITATVFASDASGNIASCTSQITVVDAMGPDLTCPDDQTVDPGPGNLFYEIPDYFATGEATATDNCTDPVTITSQDPAAGTLVPDGTYTVTITAEDEYGNVSTCTFELTVESVLGLDDTILDNAISIYPNPASSTTTLANTANVLLDQAAIYDTNGRLIRTIDLSDMQQEMTIDVSDLATGVYMVLITSENASTVKRLVKE